MTDEFNYLAQYQPNLPSNNLELIAKAKEFANSAYANNTISAYQKDWQSFKKWCNSENLCPLPCLISTLSLYITYLADNNYKTSTIHRHICAINKIHNIANHILNLKDRDFSIVWQGIKRKLGLKKTGKSPILLSHLKQIVKEINGDSNQEIRDRALLLFGWASAMRRSEINALNWTDIQYVEKGILVTIKTSKTDQFSFGQKIAIIYGRNEDTCPVRSLQKWQTISKGNEPIFTSINKSDQISYTRLSDRDIARIIKKLLARIEIDPDQFAGHSLRSGFITTAAKHSVPDRTIMKHSRHKSIQMLQVYTRDNSLIEDNATAMVGL